MMKQVERNLPFSFSRNDCIHVNLMVDATEFTKLCKIDLYVKKSTVARTPKLNT